MPRPFIFCDLIGRHLQLSAIGDQPSAKNQELTAS